MTHDPRLDRALAAWARHDPTDDAAVARLLDGAGSIADRPAAGPARWLALGTGGLLAASIALALLMNGRPALVPLAPLDPGASFALLYTPTPEEEYLL